MQPRILTLLILAFGCFYSGECQSLSCPKVRTTSGWLDLFPIPCRKSTECTLMGTQHLCCKGFCTKGVVAQEIRTTEASSSVDEPSSSVVEPSTSTSPSTSTTSTTTSTTTSSTTTTTTTPSTTTSTTTTTTTTTTTPKPTTTTTTEPPRPFLQLLPIQLAPTAAPAKIGKTQKLACPKNPAGGLFPIPCESNAQCRASSGPGQVCCKGQCVKGVPAPRPVSEESHQPILGVIPRECPTAPLGELLFEVQTCKTDSDCWPRVCCPDGTRSYCRTARARLDLVPVANRIEAPVRMLESYLQCTAPPKFDSFPQRCSSSIDCFPNLCCAEGGKKHCRPPQRSLFALLAGAAARLG
ncbi:integumentary mucin C.1-like isoform X2 [Maniola jurtina]|uniref:integumentary mucin C.1-like isoform X2 n=1 Tax=Maniola jurtina TaxID=191418 RepID=UPI001E68933D|nr:integumentary mucin C.1-like isoform X2 [Maniola jurtina]